jgi:NTP pyrophosphatase (non-canonical NTP hydrolase)
METIMDFQKDFDRKRGWDWSAPKDMAEKVEFLEYGVIATTGELGEFANLLKKTLREHHSSGVYPDEHLEHMKEELVDIFIYVIKMAMALEMDLEKGYYKKMEENEERFKKYIK